MKRIFGLLLVLVLITGLAFAESDKSFMESRYQVAVCNADFSIAEADELVAADENADTTEIDEKVDEVNENLELLQDYIDTNARTTFTAQLGETYASIRQLNLEVRQQTREMLKGKAPSDRGQQLNQFREQHRENFDEYVECRKGAVIGFAEARLHAYEVILDNWEDRIERLEDNNVDTSGMKEIIEDAREQVLDPLEEVINSDDYNTARDGLKEYCLYDGCEQNNFHFNAKMEIAKLQALLDGLSDVAEDEGFGEELDAAQESLDDAESALEELGGAKYTNEARRNVWDNMKNCAQEAKGIVKGIANKYREQNGDDETDDEDEESDDSEDNNSDTNSDTNSEGEN